MLLMFILYMQSDKKYGIGFDEYIKLKQDENNLRSSLITKEQEYKELEKKLKRIQEDMETKIRESMDMEITINKSIGIQQAKYKECKMELNQIFKILNVRAIYGDVSNHSYHENNQILIWNLQQ